MNNLSNLINQADTMTWGGLLIVGLAMAIVFGVFVNRIINFKVK